MKYQIDIWDNSWAIVFDYIPHKEEAFMTAELKWKHDPVTNTWSYTIVRHFHRKSYRKARWRKWMERAIKNDIKDSGDMYGVLGGGVHWDMLMIFK